MFLKKVLHFYQKSCNISEDIQLYATYGHVQRAYNRGE